MASALEEDNEYMDVKPIVDMDAIIPIGVLRRGDTAARETQVCWWIYTMAEEDPKGGEAGLPVGKV